VFKIESQFPIEGHRNGVGRSKPRTHTKPVVKGSQEPKRIIVVRIHPDSQVKYVRSIESAHQPPPMQNALTSKHLHTFLI